jgi:hypothetical protein
MSGIGRGEQVVVIERTDFCDIGAKGVVMGEVGDSYIVRINGGPILQLRRRIVKPLRPSQENAEPAVDVGRLLRMAAAALERVQVGECQACREAEHILEQVVTLSGEYVPKGRLDQFGGPGEESRI